MSLQELINKFAKSYLGDKFDPSINYKLEEDWHDEWRYSEQTFGESAGIDIYLMAGEKNLGNVYSGQSPLQDFLCKLFEG